MRHIVKMIISLIFSVKLFNRKVSDGDTLFLFMNKEDRPKFARFFNNFYKGKHLSVFGKTIGNVILLEKGTSIQSVSIEHLKLMLENAELAKSISEKLNELEKNTVRK